MSTQNPDDLTAAAAAELRRDMSGLSPDEQAAAKTMLGSVGDKWWLLLALGIISLIVGVLIMLNPAQAFNVILIFFGIWLIVSGILNIVRGFGDKLESGARVLSIIVGALSLILGVLCFRSWTDAALILIIFVGVSLIFRGLLELMIGLSAKGEDGRGWLIFMGIVTLLLGVAFIAWPGLAGATIIYFLGISLIIVAIFEIIASFRVRSLSKQIDRVVAQI